MQRRSRLLVMIVAVAALAAACESDSYPTGPDAIHTSVPGVLRVDGPTDIAELGGTVQYRATLLTSNSVTYDVTTQSSWRVGGNALTVLAPGLMRVDAFGWGHITIGYLDGRTATTRVRVAPDGVFVIDGGVAAPGVDPYTGLDGADVHVQSRAGTFDLETRSGYFAALALGETTITVAKDGYCTETIRLEVATDTPLDVWLDNCLASGTAVRQ